MVRSPGGSRQGRVRTVPRAVGEAAPPEVVVGPRRGEAGVLCQRQWCRATSQRSVGRMTTPRAASWRGHHDGVPAAQLAGRAVREARIFSIAWSWPRGAPGSAWPLRAQPPRRHRWPGSAVGRRRLDVLADDDDRQQHQLEEGLSDPGDDDDRVAARERRGRADQGEEREEVGAPHGAHHDGDLEADPAVELRHLGSAVELLADSLVVGGPCSLRSAMRGCSTY